MRYWKHWHFTKKRTLLLTALAITVLPVFFILPLPMQIFTLAAAAAVLVDKPVLKLPVLFLGLACVVLSVFFIGVEEIQTLQTFVKVIISLLLTAAAAQLLSRKVNFYLLITPFLLLSLSLFFHTSITALFYSVFALFMLASLLLTYQMQTVLLASMKVAFKVFMLSMPVIIVLFLFFPRISFDRGEFGFSQSTSAIKGHEGRMHTTSKALNVLSERKVMEIEITRGNVQTPLYIRGSVLYDKNATGWSRGEVEYLPERLHDTGAKVHYDITLQPHFQHYIYSLDYPLEAIEEARLTGARTIHSDKNIVEQKRYSLRSAQTYRALEDSVGQRALEYDAGANKTLQQQAREYSDLSDTGRFEALKELFLRANLQYTLSPPVYGRSNFADSFLYEQKSGYCVHFASAFATAARIFGLPSRVVTGYLGKKEARIENYYVIRQKDAHAWSEVYLPKRGWVRVDATTMAVSSDEESTQALNQNSQSYLWINYIKYKLQKWVLYYNYLTQNSFFFRPSQRQGVFDALYRRRAGRGTCRCGDFYNAKKQFLRRQAGVSDVAAAAKNGQKRSALAQAAGTAQLFGPKR